MKPSYKLIYHNDFTNILTCESPYHHEGEEFRPEMMDRNIDESSGLGVDAFFLQAGNGHLPLYPSEIYGMKEHLRWWKEYFGVDPLDSPKKDEVSLIKWILNGGDVIQRALDRCRLRGQSFFISHRVNDVHFAEHMQSKGNFNGIHFQSRFYAEHLKDQLKDRTQYWFDWAPRALDWENPEIPSYHIRLIEEQCKRYDIDGYELDFMRYPAFFAENVSLDKRREILAEFIRQVRSILDKTQTNRERFFSVRIPSLRNKDEVIGIDLDLWKKMGVDIFNASSFYRTCQEADYKKTRELTKGARLYLEMTHTTRVGKFFDNSRGVTGDGFSFRRTTPFQFYTTAQLAYSAGFDGVVLFNFQYYRKHGNNTDKRGPFGEPPFYVLPRLKQSETLNQWPLHYFLSGDHYIQHFVPDGNDIKNRGPQLPQELSANKEVCFSFPMKPDVYSTGILRIETELLSDIQENVKVYCDGELLNEKASLREPFDFCMTSLTEIAQRGAAWYVPPGARGSALEIKIVGGENLKGNHKIVFADLSFAAPLK